MRASLFFLASMIVLTLFFARTTKADDAGPKDAGTNFDAAVVASTSAAFAAAPVLPQPDDTADYIGALAAATKDGQWRAVSALLILGVVWALRKWGSKKVSWFATKWGGVTLALSMGILAQFVTDLTGPSPLSWTFVLNGLVQGALASGAWSLIKNATEKSGPTFPAPPLS
jgi:hypothetical protein